MLRKGFVLRTYRDLYEETLCAECTVVALTNYVMLRAHRDDGNTSAYLKEKIARFQDKVDDLNRSVDELCSEIAIDKVR